MSALPEKYNVTFEKDRKVKTMNKKNTYYGEFGGQYVSESLMNTLEELDEAFEAAIRDPEFIKQYNYYLKQYVGRETPLYYAERLKQKIRHQNIFETGRLKSYRCAQDQQRDWSDSAGKTYG